MPLRPRNSQAAWTYVLPSMAILLLIGLHWAQPPTTIAQIDLAPPYDAATMLRKCVTVWNHVHSFIGSVDNCFSWTPYYALLAFLEHLFGPSYGQALMFTLPVLASWLGAYKCVEVLGAPPPAAFAAAWVYAFNPARQSMIGMFSTGDVCAAVLPWVFFWIMQAALSAASRRYIAAALTTLSFGILVILAITPQLLVALLLGALIWTGFASKFALDGPAFWRWVGGTAALITVASLWWVVPNIVSYMGVLITHQTDPLSLAWTFARASLLNELRFCATWFWQYPEYNPWAVGFDKNWLLYATGFVPAAGLGVALILTRGFSRVVTGFATALALVMLFLAKGLHPPLAALNLAFYHLPGMFLFIEPYGPILIAALCMAIALGMGIQAAFGRGQTLTERIAGSVLVIVAVSSAFLSNLATVTGAIFHEQMNFLPDVHIRLPGDWVSLQGQLNNDDSSGGVLILPVDDFYQVDYDWGYHGVDLLPVALLHRDVLMPGAPLTYTQTPEARDINLMLIKAINSRSTQVVELLHEVGIRYVVVRNDVSLLHGFRTIPADLAGLFGVPPRMFGALELYDLGPPEPYVQIVSRLSQLPSTVPNKQAKRVRVISYRSMRYLGAFGGLSIPAIVGRTAVTSTSVAYDVVNPAPGSLTLDIFAAVWPRFPTRYALSTDDGQHRSVLLAPSPATRWVRFEGLTLRSGLSHFVLSEPPSFVRNLQQFLAPRYFQDERARPRVHEVFFSAIKSEPPGTKSDLSMLRGFDLNVSPMANPTMTVTPVGGEGQSTGWVIDVELGRDVYRCFTILGDKTEYSLNDSVKSCMGNIGRELTERDARKMTILRLNFATRYGGEPIARVQIESDSPSKDIILNNFDDHVALAHALLPLGLGAVVNLQTAGPTNVVVSEAFSPTWMAVEIGHFHSVLPHARASGWRNAWRCVGPGRVYIINWLVACQYVLLILGAAMVLYAWSRRSS